MKQIDILFRILLSIQCWGLASLYKIQGSKLSAYLFLEQSWEENYSNMIDIGLMTLLCSLGVLIWFKNRRPILLVAFTLFITEAYFTFILGGSFGSELSLLAQIARYGWPLIMGFAFLSHSRWLNLGPSEVFGLRLIVGITFFVHGLEAIQVNPRFLDYIILGFPKFFGVHIPELQAAWVLKAIGIIDLCLGILIVVRPRKNFLIYMCLWGFITALMRVVFSGKFGVPEFMIRAPHWILPLAIILYYEKIYFRKMFVPIIQGTKAPARNSIF